MLIRAIQETDNPALATIVRNTFPEFDLPLTGTVYADAETDSLYQVFQAPGSVYWVAEIDGHVAGGCGLFKTPGLPDGYAELVKFYLDPTARGTGVGKALLEETFSAAPTLGYRHIYLESFPELTKAIGIYEKLGFQRLSAPMGNSGHHACNVWMLKQLP